MRYREHKYLFIIPLLVLLFATSSIAGVFYRIEGILSVNKKNVTVHTEKGRVFQLKMSLKKAQKFNNKTVQIDGIAEDAARTSVLKVKKIRNIADKIISSNLPYVAKSKPSKIIAQGKDEIKVKNVRWDSSKKAKKGIEYSWTTATIKPDMVEKAYFVLKPFAPEWIAAHALMFIKFKDGGFVNAKGVSSDGLVLSIEAYLRENEKYGLKEGLKRNFHIVWQLTTWEEYSKLTCDFQKGRLKAIPIKFNHAQTKNLLLEVLKQADVDRTGEYYHTTRNNCTNNLVILMNKVTKERKIRFWLLPSLIYNVRATMPVWVPKYLIRKGFLENKMWKIDEKNFFIKSDELFVDKTAIKVK
jgi:hypothetical protein